MCVKSNNKVFKGFCIWFVLGTYLIITLVPCFSDLKKRKKKTKKKKTKKKIKKNYYLVMIFKIYFKKESKYKFLL